MIDVKRLELLYFNNIFRILRLYIFKLSFLLHCKILMICFCFAAEPSLALKITNANVRNTNSSLLPGENKIKQRKNKQTKKSPWWKVLFSLFLSG